MSIVWVQFPAEAISCVFIFAIQSCFFENTEDFNPDKSMSIM